MEYLTFFIKSRTKVSPSVLSKNRTSEPLEWLHHLILIFLVLVTSLVVFGLFDLFLTSKEQAFQIMNILLHVCIAFYLTCKLIGDLQNVYLFFGMFRNPLYPRECLTRTFEGSIRSVSQSQTILQHLRVVRLVILRLIAPLLMIAVVSIDCFLNRIHKDQGFNYWRVILVFRAYRWVKF